jgi:hypothetical protein
MCPNKTHVGKNIITDVSIQVMLQITTQFVILSPNLTLCVANYILNYNKIQMAIYLWFYDANYTQVLTNNKVLEWVFTRNLEWLTNRRLANQLSLPEALALIECCPTG